MLHVILFWTEGIEFSRNHRSALFNAKLLKKTPDDTEFNQKSKLRKEEGEKRKLKCGKMENETMLGGSRIWRNF
jgi:hypothetical protein